MCMYHCLQCCLRGCRGAAMVARVIRACRVAQANGVKWKGRARQAGKRAVGHALVAHHHMTSSKPLIPTSSNMPCRRVESSDVARINFSTTACAVGPARRNVPRRWQSMFIFYYIPANFLLLTFFVPLQLPCLPISTWYWRAISRLLRKSESISLRSSRSLLHFHPTVHMN